MNFEWNPEKSERNERVRGFGFAYATTVFLDEYAIEEFNRFVDAKNAIRSSEAQPGVRFCLSFTPGESMKKNQSAESSQREPRHVMSENDIRNYAQSESAKADSARIHARGLEPTPEDLEEIPALTEEQLARMHRVKEPITIRLDSDILAWLKSQPGPYQTRVNSILRYHMEHSAK